MARLTRSRLFLLPLCLVLIVFVVAGVAGTPHEDASILYSYARSLATTGHITYYSGGEIAEGATSFLWMLLLALGSVFHLDPHLVANLINAAACLVIASAGLLVLRAERGALPVFAGVFFSVCIVTGVGAAAQTGFCAMFFASLVIMSGALLSTRRLHGAAVAGILTCLARPDGTVYWGAIWLAQAWLVLTSTSTPRPVALRQLGGLVLCGVAVVAGFALYWAWRADYFGSFFPLPYYVKAGQSPADSFLFLKSVLFGSDARASRIAIAAFLVVVLALLAIRRPLARQPLCQAATVLIIALLYLSRFQLMQNVEHRFESTGFLYVLFWFAIAAAREPFRARWFAVLLLGCALLTPLKSFTRGLAKSVVDARINNIAPLARALRRAAPSGVTLLVTEAGRIPYFTGFPTTDAWGLNTGAYSKVPLHNPDDVAAHDPTLIVIHGKPGPLDYLCESLDQPRPVRDWELMTRALMTGATRAPHPYRVFAFPVWKLRSMPRRDLFLLQAEHPAAPAFAQILTNFGALDLGPANTLLANDQRCRYELSRLTG